MLVFITGTHNISVCHRQLPSHFINSCNLQITESHISLTTESLLICCQNKDSNNNKSQTLLTPPHQCLHIFSERIKHKKIPQSKSLQSLKSRCSFKSYRCNDFLSVHLKYTSVQCLIFCNGLQFDTVT